MPGATAPPPTGPVLTLASYNGTGALTLVFDRAIDFSAFNGAAIVVDDQADGVLWDGQTASASGPTGVLIALTDIGETSGDDILLTASA